MNCNEHKINGISVLEIDDDTVKINKIQDLLDIVSDYSIKKIILKQSNMNPDFFDLHTGFASEILQKVKNYKLFIGIVGDFESIEDKNMRDFIYESNIVKRILFKQSVKDVLRVFCKN